MIPPNNINVAVCGHISHGKSTLVGRLADELNQVDPTIKKKADKFIKEYGSKLRINIYSAIVARTVEEKEQGRTYLPSHIRIILSNGNMVTLIDTPGHEGYKRGRAYGLFSADAALLVVSVSEGIQDQTIEALQFLKALNTPLAGVIITKMDLVTDKICSINSLEENIKDKIKSIEVPLLKEDFPIIGLSALHDDNLFEFIEIIESIKFLSRNEEGPLRYCIQGKQEIFEITGIGAVAKGIIESGVIKKDDEIILEPASSLYNIAIKTRVKNIELARGSNELKGEPISTAKPRDLVSANISMKYSELEKYIENGGIFSHLNEKPRVAKQIEAEITVLDKPTGAYIGWVPYILTNVLSTTGKMIDIIEVRTIGENWKRLEKSFIREGDQAKVIINLQRPIPIEEFSIFPKLARFTLRDHNVISGIGICTKIRESYI